ncbi:trypsin-like peptidase domain-containing protein [Leucobacter sp. GX24907]
MSITPEQDQNGAAAHQPTSPLPDTAAPSARTDGPVHSDKFGAAQPTPHAQAQPTAPTESQHASSGSGTVPPAYAPPVYTDTPQATPQYAAQSRYESVENGRASERNRSRGGGLLAGLAIGALLGGLVGGGVAAVVAANASGQSAVQNTSGGGVLTLDNPESATAISGVAAVATPSVVTLEVSSGTTAGSGSGVVYDEDGYILTNAHVVSLDGAASGDSKIRVKLSDGRILDGEVVGTAPYADLAVVKVEADDLTPITVADSSKLNVGDLTVAIGAPLNLANTVTSGVVSSLNRGISVGSPLIPQDPGQQDESVPDEGDGNGFPWDFRFETPDDGQQQQQSSGGSVTIPVIQTDASINPGNSGGALLNSNGELIGINVAIASAAGEAAAGSDGLGFAIPSQLASRIADEIIAGEKPSHGLLGANVADSSQDTDADANHAGGLLVEVSKGGAAEEAGLRSGDVITSIDGVAAVDGTSVSALVRMHPGGSEVQVEYTRNGTPGETTVKLGTLDW